MRGKPPVPGAGKQVPRQVRSLQKWADGNLTANPLVKACHTARLVPSVAKLASIGSATSGSSPAIGASRAAAAARSSVSPGTAHGAGHACAARQAEWGSQWQRAGPLAGEL